jgi:hypothetical protein
MATSSQSRLYVYGALLAGVVFVGAVALYSSFWAANEEGNREDREVEAPAQRPSEPEPRTERPAEPPSRRTDVVVPQAAAARSAEAPQAQLTPVEIKECMQSFLAPSGEHANDHRQLERAARGACKLSGYRALQDVFVRHGHLNLFIEAVNRCYHNSIATSGANSAFLEGVATTVRVLANMASNGEL